MSDAALSEVGRQVRRKLREAAEAARNPTPPAERDSCEDTLAIALHRALNDLYKDEDAVEVFASAGRIETGGETLDVWVSVDRNGGV
jgi:hypothetical protein